MKYKRLGGTGLLVSEIRFAASGVTFDARELETLDQVSALPREYPGWMIERQSANRVADG
jgi:hypothetical protein